MLAAIVPNSAKPFNFHTEFAMTEEMVSCPLINQHVMHMHAWLFSLSCFVGLFHIQYVHSPAGPESERPLPRGGRIT